jgi:hypothetical protein
LENVPESATCDPVQVMRALLDQLEELLDQIRIMLQKCCTQTIKSDDLSSSYQLHPESTTSQLSSNQIILSPKQSLCKFGVKTKKIKLNYIFFSNFRSIWKSMLNFNSQDSGRISRKFEGKIIYCKFLVV